MYRVTRRRELTLLVIGLVIVVAVLGSAQVQAQDDPDIALTILGAQPDLTWPGGELTITYQVDNYGGDFIRPSRVTFYLCHNVRLWRTEGIKLPPPDIVSPRTIGQEQTHVVTVPTKVETGRYYLLGWVDESVIDDSNPSNNIAVWAPVMVGEASDTSPPPKPGPKPDADRIVFHRGADIYKMDADGSNVTQLTTDPAGDYDPHWSPDHTEIVFTSFRGGPGQNYVMNADGTNQHNISNTGTSDYYPAWSSDGSQIAFSRNGEIWVMDTDGNNQLQVTTGGPDLFSTWCGNDRIVFQSYRDGDWDIWAVNSDGTSLTQLTDGPEMDEFPACSPDGNTIAFSRVGDLWLMDPDGSNQQMVGSGIFGLGPTWSPDSSQLAFEGSSGGIHIVDVDGTGEVPITSDNDWAPSWGVPGGGGEPPPDGLPFEEDLDSDPGWPTGGQWEFGVPLGQGGTSYGNPDPTSGYTGENVYGVNLSGDYSTTVGGPYYLTTNAIDCSGHSDVHLKFYRWLNTDYRPYVSATVEVSNDGSNWTEVFINPEMTEIADSNWQLMDYDISAVADGQSTLYIRWGYEILASGAYPCSGWNLDDIEVTGIPTGYSISGQVKKPDDTPLGDIQVSTTGASDTTDSDGNYELTGLAAGVYTVTPSKTNYTFTPTEQPDVTVGPSQTGVDFVGTYTGTDTTPPTVEITYPVDGETYSDIAEITGTAADESGGSGVKEVKVVILTQDGSNFWNGTSWGPFDSNTCYLPTEGTTSWSKTTGLPSSWPDGAYYIDAWGWDNVGNDTPSPYSVGITMTSGGDGVVNYHAVICGISDYEGTINDLDYCDDDAYDIRDALLASENWTSGNITVLIDSAATKSGIQSAIQDMGSAADADDVCLFTFSGHGTTGSDDDGDETDGVDEFLCTHAFSNIRDDELGDWMAALPTNNYVVFLDACYSGGHIKSLGAVKGIGDVVPAPGDGFAADLRRMTLKDLDDNGYGVVVTACDDNETCWEHPTLENGVFTYYLVEGMAGPGDSNTNDWISGEECHAYTAPRATSFNPDQHAQLYDGHSGELEYMELTATPPPAAPVMDAEPPYTPGDSNTVSWGSVSGADEYYVEWATDSNFNNVVGNSGWITATQYQATGLADGQIYYYHVKARNAGGESGWSNPVSSTQDATPPTITGWQIAATHTGVGEVLTSISEGYVEPRNCGISCLVVTFSEPIDPATVTGSAIQIVGVNSGDVSGLVDAGGLTLTGGDTILRILFSPALPDQDTYTVTISSAICDPAGNPLAGDRDIEISGLKGDANGTKSVNGGDLLAVRARIGQPVEATTARYDVNLTGSINGGDLLATRAQIGHSAP